MHTLFRPQDGGPSCTKTQHQGIVGTARNRRILHWPGYAQLPLHNLLDPEHRRTSNNRHGDVLSTNGIFPTVTPNAGGDRR